MDTLSEPAKKAFSRLLSGEPAVAVAGEDGDDDLINPINARLCVVDGFALAVSAGTALVPGVCVSRKNKK